MPTSIGIDFGTHSLRLASPGKDGRPQRVGNPIPIWRAVGLSQEPVGDLPIKTNLDKVIRIGTEPVFLADFALRILQSVRAEAERYLKTKVEGCVTSICWQSGNMQREILRSTARKAGYKVTRLINDSAAVALSQCDPTEGERKILVYSLGAGSLEVAIALRSRGAYRELAAGSLEELSGNNLTRRLFHSLREELIAENLSDPHGMEADIWKLAEEIKRQLSNQEQIELEKPLGGRDLDVSRQRLEGLIQVDLASGLELCKQLLERAGFQTPNELDEIWLAGGSTQIPLISSMLAQWSGKRPNKADEYAVAYGAALQAVHLDLKEDVEAQPAQSTPARSFSPFELFRASPDIFRSPPAASDKGMPTAEFEKALLDHVEEADKHLAQENFDGALEQLQEAMGFFQARKARVYLAWGKSLEGQDDLDHALGKFQQALQLDHRNATIREALERLKLKIDYREADLAFRRGEGLERKGDLSGASESYKSAYAKHRIPKYAEAYARTLFQKALGKIARFDEYTARRKRNMAIGALKEARNFLADCVNLDPTNHEYRQVLDGVSRSLRGG
ncbi:MAG: Hsp70 family protein [Chloroflexota bacterium]